MSRLVFGLLGAVLALFPERSLDAYESFAIENPDGCERKAWVAPAVRAEGLVFAIAGLTSGKAYARLLTLAGAAGGVALFAPKRYLDFGARLGYAPAGEVEWNGRFVAFVRCLGAFDLLVAIRALRRRRADR